MKKLILILCLVLLTACTHQIRFINPNDGTIIYGTYNTVSQTVEVTMPTGEKLKGDYVPLENVSIGTGSLFYGTGVATGLGFGAGGSANGYALLLDGKGTVMEIVFQYSQWSGHGFGTAKTNKGNEYKVMF